MTSDHRAQGDVICAYNPDVIETSDDSPVLLDQLLPGSLASGSEAAGLRVVRIDGYDTSGASPIELPGIRIGEGEGSGYIFRRALDSQFVFVPDLRYSGITTFTYTIADDAGDEATVVATVSVQPTTLVDNHITFTNGALSASVVEGMDAAILGAISFNGEFHGGALEFRVFEGETDSPSPRFAITGDTLRALERLDSSAESTIILKVAAYEDGSLIATSELAIEVRPEGSHAGEAAPDTAVPGVGMPNPRRSEDAAVAASIGDQFHFMDDMKSEFGTTTVLAFRAPVRIGEGLEADPAAAARGCGAGDLVAGNDEASNQDPAPPEGGDWFGV